MAIQIPVIVTTIMMMTYIQLSHVAGEEKEMKRINYIQKVYSVLPLGKG